MSATSSVVRSAAATVRFGLQPCRVLVTGGTGFIGRVLVSRLLADGHDVVVWSRQPARAASDRGQKLRFVQRLDEVPVDDRIDVVVNLAGARILGLPWTARRREQLMQSRAGLTRKLVAWLGTRPTKPWLMLSGSAIGYYGVQSQGDSAAWTEATPPQSAFMSRLCVEWEEAAGTATALGATVRCLRFGLVLGRGGALPQLLLPIRLGVGGRLGTGGQVMSWIHIEDLVRAAAHVWTLAERTPSERASPSADSDAEAVSVASSAAAAAPAASEAFNFTAPHAPTQAEFGRIAAKLLHRPFWLPTPAAPVRMVLGEQSQLLLDGQRVHPRRLLDTGFEFRYPDVESALKDLL